MLVNLDYQQRKTLRDINLCILILCVLSTSTLCLDPLKQIQLYPNTQNSDSIYIFSFKLSKSIPSQSYILINMDWYSSDILPYTCIMINTSISLSCTNFKTPSFPLTITVDKLKQHNPHLTQTKTVVILIKNNLVSNTEYNLQLHLYNKIPNIRKISPSAEIYTVSSQGLVYEENINYGAAINKPPIDINLQTSVIQDQSLNKPGSLSKLKAQFKISKAIQTTLSAFTLVLHHPFSFSLGSTPRSSAIQLWATSPIALYSKPTIYQYRIISPNIFYVVFNQSFIINRRFILQITQINNPYLLAQSNISIYSMNYNSLTPLQGNQHGYIIKTVSYPIGLGLGFPYDQPAGESKKFYKGIYQYVKLDITILEKTVPEKYSIRIVISGGTISPGTAYASFQSLTYDHTFTYGTNYIIIKNMGTLLIGSVISTTFQIQKDPSTTPFYFDVYIDTQQIIQQFTATNYLYQSRIQGTSYNKNSFLKHISDNIFGTGQPWRVSHDTTSTSYLTFEIKPQGTQDTSAGAYLQIFLSPYFIIDNDFNSNNDCRFNSVGNVGSAICTREKTPNHLKLKITSVTSIVNPFPKGSTTTIYIYNILPPRSTSNKYIFPCYFTLYKTDGVGSVQYYDTRILTILPKYNGLSNIRMQQHGNVYDKDYTYPGFLRVQSTDITQMSYTIQQNQIRVITVISRYGFAGMGNIKNQQKYPCTSNINVKCIYYKGHADYSSQVQHLLEWDRIVIIFPDGEQDQKIFHVVIPDSVIYRSDNYYYHLVGIYNQFTKDFKYIHMKDAYRRTSWQLGKQNVNTNLYIDMGGKAGSYRNNVTIYAQNNEIVTTDYTYLCISTSWSFYQKGISSINAQTLALTNPIFNANYQSLALSVYMGDNMYLTVIPLKYLASASISFEIKLDNVHMPYDYDLPNYYIYFYSATQGTNGNYMSSSNQFIMTNANIFYESPLKSLSVQCLSNALGVKNTICRIYFGTQHPLKADGKIVIVFSGMTIATNICKMYYQNGTIIPVTGCSSTEDNRNLTISLSGWQHYTAGNFSIVMSGIGIQQSQISQSFTLYLYDPTNKYIIQKGTRILTTTIAKTKFVQVYQILYNYNSPLAYNSMSIRFYLPRTIYQDQQFGIILGKDLSDVNTEIKRLNIQIIRNDGVKLKFLYRLISSEYKVMFTFDNINQLIQGNYTMQIYGIRTPASHKNGNFQIIFQRKYDKKYTLINEFRSQFPTLGDYIFSDISIQSYFNTQGYQQQIDITIKHRRIPVNNKIIWIVNFPSYYSPLIFNNYPYCLIDGSPINCYADPNTPYQLIITDSPRIVPFGTSYKLSILGIACPRFKYMHNVFPNRYIFIGILQSSLSSSYQQTTLIYPQQTIYQNIQGIIQIQNIQVPSTSLTSFYISNMVFVIKCNVDLVSGDYLYLIFPQQFNNFNNKQLNVILKTTTNVLGTMNAPVIDKRVEIQLNNNIPANTILKVQITNVPTPTNQVVSEMSNTVSYVTYSTKKRIKAASASSGNSAPKLSFTKDSRYISFNNDQQIVITAGTYSQPIYITSSDNNPFLTNVKVTMSSVGFVFEPTEVLLKLGNTKGEFKIAADKDLHPLSYFYSATKTEEVFTNYKITTNNNIRITNTPVQILIPTSINLPIGGCSSPIIIKLSNPPLLDMTINFNYDNSIYSQNLFYPNPHTTKSRLLFTKSIDNNTISFCTSNNITGTSIPVALIITGTNYNSYQFTPNNIITFNLITLSTILSPIITINMINQQKTFVDFNLTLNVDSIVYYNLFIGDSNTLTQSVENIQVYIKNNQAILQSKNDFITSIYLNDRDRRVGMYVFNAPGQYTVRFNDMIPQTKYILCTYLQNRKKQLTGPFCKSMTTQNWGYIQVMKVQFTKTITNFQLNKVMCFFTKYLNTKTDYLVNSQGNSCNDNTVHNTNFNYISTTFSNDKRSTFIYLITNPTLTSDPSILAFKNMVDNTGTLKSTVLSAALSGYGIDFMSGVFIKQIDARSITSRSNAMNIQVYYNKPYYKAITNQIVIDNIFTNQQVSTVYFALVLYKKFEKDPITNLTSVKIRLNTDLTPWQLMNCKNGQNLTVQGCTRAIWAGEPITVTIGSILPNCMYLLYYIGANEYPFRPIVGYNVLYEPIVTLVYAEKLILSFVILVLFTLMLS